MARIVVDTERIIGDCGKIDNAADSLKESADNLTAATLNLPVYDGTFIPQVKRIIQPLTGQANHLRGQLNTCSSDARQKVQEFEKVDNAALNTIARLEPGHIIVVLDPDYDPDRVDTLVIEEIPDVFGKPFGANQGDLKDAKYRGEMKNGKVVGYDEDIYNFVRSLPGYEHYTDKQIYELMDQMNKEGCSFAATVNAIFLEFNGGPAAFYETFGFPMLDKEGNLNFNMLMLDLYCRTNDKFYLTKNEGMNEYARRMVNYYRDNPKEFEKKYHIPFNENKIGEIKQKILSDCDGDIAYIKDSGQSWAGQINKLTGYLEEKGIDAVVSYSTRYNEVDVVNIRKNLVDCQSKCNPSNMIFHICTCIYFGNPRGTVRITGIDYVIGVSFLLLYNIVA